MSDDAGARERAWAIARTLEATALPSLPSEHGPLAAHPFGLQLRLDRLGDVPWTTLRLSQHTAVGLGTWITWTGPGGTSGQAFAPPGVAWALSPVLLELMRRLPGDAIELLTAEAGRVPILPRGTWVHPDGWWDDWKARPIGDAAGPTLGDYYEAAVHPWVIQVLERLVEDGLRLGRAVDVCGGDGALAATVADRFGARVALLERNGPSCVIARERLGPDADVREGDAASEGAWEGLRDLDVALLAGAVQVNVLTAEAARRVMERVAAALRPGGVAIVLGWSPCLLEAADFAALGFTVHNTAIPPTGDDPNPRQLYLLRR